jgi:hypothetical protein
MKAEADFFHLQMCVFYFYLSWGGYERCTTGLECLEVAGCSIFDLHLSFPQMSC